MAIAVGALTGVSSALAHVERTAYWPDPAPDTSTWPAAGGKVPAARSIASALDTKARGDTRVVCKSDSLSVAKEEVATARDKGYRFRPTERKRKLSAASAQRLIDVNTALFDKCRYHDIQPAVTASGNNDRVVVMPGTYTEPDSRAVSPFPPECDQYKTTSDHGSGAVSYEYQYHCPNAQALVAVIGRALGTGLEPQSSPTGRPDPHGIPNLGKCVRCNVQMEGSGPTPQSVVVDAGRVASGNHGPIDAKKDVGIKADRADGFVLKNMTVRHAAEHDVYVLETDGYRLQRMNFYYGGEYGALMFASDHGLTDTCDAVGNGDSAVYPGGAPDTGAQRDDSFYPTRRLNQTITHCDLHHNNLGYSGTMGNATRVVENNFYGNTTGIATDSFFAGGHPGYPQDSAVFERNRIWSNNFNVYAKDSDVESRVPVPIGVGILIAGGNDDQVKGNRIWDNWRRGTMLIAVPDVISCAPSPENGAPPCTPQGIASVSNRNRYFDNVMSRTPSGGKAPNGVDFWWDEFPTNSNNCWYNNQGADGSEASVTSDPPPPPVPGTSIPKFLPQDCSAPTNVGAGDAAKEAMLASCAGALATGNYDPNTCEWFQMPAKPGTAAAKQQTLRNQQIANQMVGETEPPPPFCDLIGGLGGTVICSPFAKR
ncbi:MAG TPA: right-handed parallel beta-helix repeat-containing protein [Thermoleophilaceae bacterium]